MDKTASQGGVQDFQTEFIFLVSPTPVSGQQTYATSAPFIPHDLAAGSPEQYTKLCYYFNMYEQYKLSKVVMKWHPRHTESISTIVGAGTSGTVTATAQDSPTNTSVNSLYTDLWRIALITDYNDFQVRSINDEYYQVAMQDNVTWLTNCSGGEHVVTPRLIDAMNNDMGTAGAEAIDDVKGRFIPTKLQLATQAPGTTVLNVATQWSAYKFYAFNPFIGSLGGTITPVPLGYFSMKYYFTFQKLDNRAIFAAPSLAPTLKFSSQIANIFDRPSLAATKTLLYEERSTKPFEPIKVLHTKREIEDATNPPTKRIELTMTKEPLRR